MSHSSPSQSRPIRPATFNANDLALVNSASSLAEELVSNAYKMSVNQWLHGRYDVKTVADLSPEEIVDGPFAQVVRYRGKRKDALLETDAFDFYKICLQDHAILATIDQVPQLSLMPFALYIVAHELIHIVRFSRFLQNFEANHDEMMAEEQRVHAKTHHILADIRLEGLSAVLDFFEKWRLPLEGLTSPGDMDS